MFIVIIILISYNGEQYLEILPAKIFTTVNNDIIITCYYVISYESWK